MALEGRERLFALKALVEAWVSRAKLPDKTKEAMLAEAEAASTQPDGLLGLSQVLRVEGLEAYRGPWIEAFNEHPLRSRMFPWMVALGAGASPESISGACENWLPWEKAAFVKPAMEMWAQRHPDEALAWSRAHPGEGGEAVLRSALDALSEKPGAVREFLDSATAPSERLAATRAMAGDLAEKDTRQAVAWADSLPEGPEKEAAHAAIYESTPRGVGALLSMKDGFPVVTQLVPDGPLGRAGFQSGDLLAGVELPDGEWKGFGGRGLEAIVGELRGEPGSQITVVAMRRDPATGKLVEHRAPVSREQLIFKKEN